MNDTIIVVDQNTAGVLCQAASVSIAHSVSMGFINSSVRLLPSSLPWHTKNYSQNFDDINIQYQYKGLDIVPMKSELITSDWAATRKLALLRNNFHNAWENKCKRVLLYRNHDYIFNGAFDGFLWQELNRCSPDTNYYSQAIIEWASIADIEPSVAYQELKFKADSIGLQYLRNHAVHQKYVILLNLETTEEGLRQVILQGYDHLIGRAEI